MGEDWNNNENQNNDYNQNGYEQNNNNEEYAFQTLMRNGRPKTMGWSVASLVIGIMSVVCCCFGYAGIILGIGAIVLSVISKKTLGYFDGMSIAGLLLGIFGVVFGAAILITMYSIPEEVWEEFYAEYQKELENQGGLPGGSL